MEEIRGGLSACGILVIRQDRSSWKSSRVNNSVIVKGSGYGRMQHGSLQ
jgi:hypothetical protein